MTACPAHATLLGLRVVAAIVLLSGCAGALGELRDEASFAASSARFVIRSQNAPKEVERVRAAIELAAPRLSRWGGLAEPVTVHLLPSHADLEGVVHRHYGWLKAWAQYDSILLQRPATWARREGELDELVLHELTHCVLFQRIGTKDDWTRKAIPLWFREGMALWTAGQGSQLPTLEDTARWIDLRGSEPLLGDAEALSGRDFEAVYGFAHHAFRFLIQRYGEVSVITLTDKMRSGEDFSTAFQHATGVGLAAFSRDLTLWLKWRAFRASGRRH